MASSLRVGRRTEVPRLPDADLRDRPLLLGRLRRSASGRVALTGHTGDVRAVPSNWYEPVRRMDGFHTVAAIAEATRLPALEVASIVETLRSDKGVGWLEDWNPTRWCEGCRVYLSRMEQCPRCGNDSIAVPFLPPCDPWILFGEEYAFVAGLLREHANVAIDDHRLLVGNNGLLDGRFFWQIVYSGKVVLHIFFDGPEPSDWSVAGTPDTTRVEWDAPAATVRDQILDLAAANRPALDELEADSLAFIDEVVAFYPRRPLLYFSGGKESVVMLHLLEKAEQPANLAFVGTGLDFPEDAAFMLEELKPRIDANPLFHLEVNVAPESLFLDKLHERGGLDARTPWCREEVKVPLKRTLTERLYGDEHFVAFEGSRWYENDFRRSHPRVNFATGYDRQIWVHPIAPWTGLDVWLYIYAEGLAVNPMYAKGFQRTTCWHCPIVNPFHVQMSRRQYPELWQKIQGVELRAFDDGDNLNTPF